MQETNGREDSPVKSNGVANGIHNGDDTKMSPVSSIVGNKSSEDIVRIIGQHLITMGLK